MNIKRRTFCFLVSCAIWGGYFAWRPPAPMLRTRFISKMSDVGQVSLTFDDAPHPLTTPLLLAALKRAQAPSTFFIIGDGARFYPELTRRIVQDGHALANHSQHHRNLTRISKERIPREIGPTFDVIRAHGSRRAWQNTRLFRPPGGGLNRAAIAELYNRDHALAWWSLNTGDWSCPPAWKIHESVTSQLRAGDIVLMHDGGLGTPQAVPGIVRFARARGLSPVVMPEAE